MGLSNITLDFSFNEDDSKLWLDLGLGSPGFCRPEVRQSTRSRMPGSVGGADTRKEQKVLAYSTL